MLDLFEFSLFQARGIVLKTLTLYFPKHLATNTILAYMEYTQ